MDDTILEGYRVWLAGFVREHAEPDERHQQNILLKEDHTRQVCDIALRIAAELGLDRREAALAGAVALFHDVGRFPQYRQFRTFQDSISVNHAVLGAKVLLERQALRALPPRERSLIVRAVTLHNVFSLPELPDDGLRLHARLVRDADKLDIWRVFTGLLKQDPAEWPSAAGLGLSNEPACTPAVLAAFERHEMVRLADLRTLNDFKLLQLAWIYDLNFAPSLRMVRERGVIDLLSAAMPHTPEIDRALDDLRHHVRCAAG